MTNTARSRQTAPDKGSILPLVLIFVVVLAVVVTAIASYTATSLRTADIADQSVSRLSAAESGMQLALQDAASSPASCTGTPVVRAPLNGAAIATTCWRVPELENLDALFALVLTGEGPAGANVPISELAMDVNGANSDNGVKDISGPVYFASPGGANLSLSLDNARAVLPDPDFPGQSVSGVVQYEPTSVPCPDPPTTSYLPTDWTGTPNLYPSVSCSERQWDAGSNPIVDDLDFSPVEFSTAVTTVAPPPTLGACDIYEPGTYPTAPSLTNPSFFKSGVYYFPAGEVEVRDDTVFGKRVGADYPDATAAGIHPDCVSAWNSDGDVSGAVLIFGNDARIFTANNSRLNVYGRDVDDLGTPVQTASRAIIALTSSQASAANLVLPAPVDGVTLPIDGSVTPTPPKLIDRANGSSGSMSFYGQVYAPHSWVDTGNAAGGAFVEFLGGIVAGRLTLKTAANVDGFSISVPTSVVNAFYIESVATTTNSISNGVSTVRTRSEQRPGPNPADRVLDVDTWRICERGSC